MIKIQLLAIFIISAFTVIAQEYEMGLLLDDSLYADRPLAVSLMRSDYGNLPESASLKKFTPTPQNQGPYGTCAGWSTAYSARTILEALRKNLEKDQIDSNSFSPSFIYNQIKISDDCKDGTSLLRALDILREKGGLKLNEFEYDCAREVTDNDIIKASEYKIIEYRDVIPEGAHDKTKFVKKSLSEGRPVVIAMDCPLSFKYSKEIWLPDSSDYKQWGRGHALTVIGYDDDKFGGAFEIMNSWGTEWGNDGFTWIRYSDFNYFTLFAFEIIDKSKNDPNTPDLSGTLLFKTSSGEIMQADFNGEYFKMKKPYNSGTMFELIISNNEPAYVYAFSSDLTYKTYKIFPFNKRMIAYLPYRQNNIAIPDEESYNILDETTGTSYFCFLYSKEEIDIDYILRKIEEEDGLFWERISHVLNNKLVDFHNITYKNDGDISFKAVSNNKSVVPVLVEIQHQ